MPNILARKETTFSSRIPSRWRRGLSSRSAERRTGKSDYRTGKTASTAARSTRNWSPRNDSRRECASSGKCSRLSTTWPSWALSRILVGWECRFLEGLSGSDFFLARGFFEMVFILTIGLLMACLSIFAAVIMRFSTIYFRLFDFLNWRHLPTGWLIVEKHADRCAWIWK